MFKLRKAAVALAASALLLSPGLGFFASAAEGAVPDSSSYADLLIDSPYHRQGNLGVRQKLPDDLKLGDTPHPCAGRYLLYREHIDAMYSTKIGGQMRVVVVAGQALVDPDKVCLRLGPDAQVGSGPVEDGTEVSRMVVPNLPAYRFLGTPGTILWYAPSTAYSNKSPIWAGLGAFENVKGSEGHEKTSYLGYFQQNQIKLALTDFRGPSGGHMELFSAQSDGSVQRWFSTRDNLVEHSVQINQHGHFDWTFSQAGIYHTTWQNSGTSVSGQVEASAPQEIVWLVGPDDAVGLPAGTTPGADLITTTAEAQRTAMGLDNFSESEAPTTPQVPPAGSRQKIQDFMTDDFGPSADLASRHQVGRGQITFSGYTADRSDPRAGDPALEGHFSATFSADSGPTAEAGTALEGGDITIEVPDTLLQQYSASDNLQKFGGALIDGWAWRLPAAGQRGAGQVAPSLHIDAQRADLSAFLATGVKTYFSLQNPFEDRVSGKFSNVWGLLDGNLAFEGADIAHFFTQGQPGPISPELVFNLPGIYEVAFSYEYPLNDQGAKDYGDVLLRFAVGNEAINATRLAHFNGDLGETFNPKPTTPFAPVESARLLPEREQGQDSGAPFLHLQPNPDTTPGSAQPGAETQPGAAGGGSGGAAAGESDAAATGNGNETNNETNSGAATDLSLLPPDLRRIITAGHVDLALGSVGGQVQAFVAEDFGADHIRRPSASVAIAVPDALAIRPQLNFWPRYQAIGQDFTAGAQKIWALPQSHIDGQPWPGFNTESFDYTRIYAGMPSADSTEQPFGGISLTLGALSGPGKMLSSVITQGFHSPLLYSQQAGLRDSSFVAPTHKHLNTMFNAPGVYAVDYVFHWNLPASGPTHSRLAATGALHTNLSTSLQRPLPGQAQSQTLRVYYLVSDATIAAARQHFLQATSKDLTSPTAYAETEYNAQAWDMGRTPLTYGPATTGTTPPAVPPAALSPAPTLPVANPPAFGPGGQFQPGSQIQPGTVQPIAGQPVAAQPVAPPGFAPNGQAQNQPGQYQPTQYQPAQALPSLRSPGRYPIGSLSGVEGGAQSGSNPQLGIPQAQGAASSPASFTPGSFTSSTPAGFSPAATLPRAAAGANSAAAGSATAATGSAGSAPANTSAAAANASSELGPANPVPPAAPGGQGSAPASPYGSAVVGASEEGSFPWASVLSLGGIIGIGGGAALYGWRVYSGLRARRGY